MDPFLVGLDGSFSLMSDMLALGLLALEPLPRCWNFTSFLGFVMIERDKVLGPFSKAESTEGDHVKSRASAGTLWVNDGSMKVEGDTRWTRKRSRWCETTSERVAYFSVVELRRRHASGRQKD